MKLLFVSAIFFIFFKPLFAEEKFGYFEKIDEPDGSTEINRPWVKILDPFEKNMTLKKFKINHESSPQGICLNLGNYYFDSAKGRLGISVSKRKTVYINSENEKSTFPRFDFYITYIICHKKVDPVVKLKDLDVQKVLKNTHSIENLKISPDSHYIASALTNKNIQIWSVSKNKVVTTLKGHIIYPYSLSWSPDSKYLASAGESSHFKVWNILTGKNIYNLKVDEGATIKALAWNPNGKYLATQDSQGTIVIWDLYKQEKLHSIKNDNCAIIMPDSFSTLSWNPSGYLLAYQCGHFHARILNLDTEKNFFYFGPISGGLSWAPNGRYLILDNKVKDLSIGTSSVLLTKSFYPSWDPSGQYIADFDKNLIKIWDLSSKENTMEVSLNFPGYSDSYHIESVDWSSNGNFIAARCSDKTIRILSVKYE